MKGRFFHKKTNLRYIILLFAVTLTLFWKVVLHPNYILWSPQSEIITDVEYWDNFRYDSMNKYGQFPLWYPYAFSGYPSVGAHWSTLLYPTSWIYLFFPSTNLYGFAFLLHFFLGGIFVYLFLKKLGIDDFSAFISSVVYILGLRFAYYVFAGFIGREASIFILPLLFYLVESYFKSKKRIYLVFASIASAFQFFGDHNQIFFYTWCIIFVYFIFRAFAIEKEKLNFSNAAKYTCIFLLMSILVVLVAAAQLFPYLKFVSASTRVSGLDYGAASVNSMPPYYLVTMLLPEFFGSYIDGSYWGIYAFWKIATYIGILPLIFVLLGIYNRNEYAKFFIFLAAFSAIFSMGQYTPVYYIFQKYVPPFTLFRVPTRMLFFFNFSLVALTGFGLNSFLHKLNSRKLAILSKAITAALIFSLVISAFAYAFKDGILAYSDNLLKNRLASSNVALNSYDFYSNKLPIVYNHIFFDILLLSAFLIASIVIFKLKIMKFNFKLINALIFIVIAVDLASHSLPLIDVKKPSEIFVGNKLADFLGNDRELSRFFDLNADFIKPDKLIGHQTFRIEGVDGLIYYDYNKYMSVLGNFTLVPSSFISIKNVAYPKMLNLLNVKYIVSDKILNQLDYKLEYNTTSNLYLADARFLLSDSELDPNLHEFIRKQDFYVYRNENYLPRAFFVPKAIVLNKDDILQKLTEKEFNPKEAVLIEKQINKSLNNKGLYKEAKIEFYSPNKIEVQIGNDYPGFLVLSEVWYPGWKAFDNGKETEIYRADYILRAIYLEKGEHKVDFIYDLSSFKAGLLITIITSFFIIAYIVSNITHF